MTNYIILNTAEAQIVAGALAADIEQLRADQTGGLAHGPVLVLQAVLMRIADAFDIEPPADPDQEGGPDNVGK